MRTIKVLIYTDYHDPEKPAHNVTLEPSDPFVSDFGLSIMHDQILKNRRPFTDIKIDLVNRNIPTHANKRLTPELLSDYDELWVFGLYQVDMSNHTPGDGGPHNELKDEEVDALRCWMETKKGGVLITGDHSEPNPKGIAQPPAPFLNLGRALGHRIPRAGQMRVWEGPPTSSKDQSFNTQTPTGVLALDELDLQSDSDPQRIFLRLYKSMGKDVPHELFQSEPTDRIHVFPDHMHEGKLVIPRPVGDEWPAGSLTPEIVAWGADYRFFPPRFYPLVSIYDGHQSSVGRIVADSSWHHYLNINLRCLPSRPVCSCSPTSVLDQIGKYYSNLVYWLAPEEVQREMNINLIRFLASHPQIVEVAGSDPVTLGKTAIFVLDQKSLSHELDGLLKAALPKELLSDPRTSTPIPRELLLGSILKSFINDRRAKANAAEPESVKAATDDEIISEGITAAFAIHLEQVESQAAMLRGLFEELKGSAPAENKDAATEDHDHSE
jgi:hypothetical protein